MFCQKCGKENSDGVKFCGSCGANIEILASPNHVPTSANVVSEPMTFGKSISTCLSKYADFSGKATRPEYWWFYLFCLLITWGSSVVAVLTIPSLLGQSIVKIMFALALFMPQISAGTRRLHDTGRSGWSQLWVFTIIGIIPVIIWLASKGNEHENKYGA